MNKSENIKNLVKDNQALVPLDNNTTILIDHIKIEFNSLNMYSVGIFFSLRTAIKMTSFEKYSKYSKSGYATVLRQFISWLNDQIITTEERFNILNNYHIFRINKCGVKPQSSGVNLIANLLKCVVKDVRLNSRLNEYLDLLLAHTKPYSRLKIDQDSITSLFEKIGWLDGEISQSDYLKIAHPSEITNSFIICISTLLLNIIDTKKKARRIFGEQISKYDSETLQPVRELEDDLRKRAVIYETRRTKREEYLFELFANIFNSHDKSDRSSVIELMKWDFINPLGISLIGNSSFYNSKSHKMLTIPNVFAIDSWQHPSELGRVDIYLNQSTEAVSATNEANREASLS